jgi:putative ABC transport system permease protein
VPETIAHIETIWTQFAPARLFEYFFMDDDLDRLYRAEATLGQVAMAFAVLAIAIAALGLFGLVAYTISQRTKEIGIRKALGASVFSILALLSKDFIRLVGIAFVIALPVAYVCAHEWLSGFAYRTALHAWVFGAAGSLALAVALITVSVQSIRVAQANPADSLQQD